MIDDELRWHMPDMAQRGARGARESARETESSERLTRARGGRERGGVESPRAPHRTARDGPRVRVGRARRQTTETRESENFRGFTHIFQRHDAPHGPTSRGNHRTVTLSELTPHASGLISTHVKPLRIPPDASSARGVAGHALTAVAGAPPASPHKANSVLHA